MGTERGYQSKPGLRISNVSAFIRYKLVPSVKRINKCRRWAGGCMENPEQMSEQRFPDPKFKLVHEINNQHPREVELDIEAMEALNERILH